MGNWLGSVTYRLAEGSWGFGLPQLKSQANTEAAMAISNFRFSNMAEFGAPLGLYKPASSEVEPKEAPRH